MSNVIFRAASSALSSADNLAAYSKITAKTERLTEEMRSSMARNNLHQMDLAELDQTKKQLSEMRALLAQAQATTKEWQASHDAWRDLAQALRDEVKACPNAEAHHFGKDDAARNNRLGDFENKKRIELGLKPRPD
jgi:uncharacterized protein with von Willebrand factor type A (vWA) domain